MNKCTVLFIDDEPLICECFLEQFESSDIEILTFTSPKIAIEYLNSNSVDAIFLDYRMPGFRGDDLAELMPSRVPKYLVSGELDVQPNYPFVDVLPKPFNIEKMENIFKELVKFKTTN